MLIKLSPWYSQNLLTVPHVWLQIGGLAVGMQLNCACVFRRSSQRRNMMNGAQCTINGPGNYTLI